jgi:hypothetical protein
MNAIAAHKDGLKKLLDNLTGDTCSVRHRFVASLNAYITRLAANRSTNQHPRQESAATANEWRINMESTLTRNCALYYAEHKMSKRRATLFKKFRAAARKQGPDVRQQLTCGELLSVPRFHRDNGC